jgi:hypothetical protein
MFAEARVDSFIAILRKRTASLMGRVSESPNSLVKLVFEYPASAMWKHWNSIHMGSRGMNVYNIF